MIPLSLTHKRQNSKPPGVNLKVTLLKVELMGTLGPYLENYTSLWTFWAYFMLVPRVHCSSHFITDTTFLYRWQPSQLWVRTIKSNQWLGVKKWEEKYQKSRLFLSQKKSTYSSLVSRAPKPLPPSCPPLTLAWQPPSSISSVQGSVLDMVVLQSGQNRGLSSLSPLSQFGSWLQESLSKLRDVGNDFTRPCLPRRRPP